MMTKGRKALGLTDADLDFLRATAVPEVKDRASLRKIIESDEDFRNAFLSDDHTVKKVMTDKEVFLKISPRLYFEILLRKARKDLEGAGYTLERAGSQKIAVFDTKKVVDLLSRPAVLAYLADMLASFTKVGSYAITYRVRKGIWRKIKFSDLDIDSLIRFCEWVDEEHRVNFFKRIGDVCLFILGVFPEYVQLAYRYPSSGEKRPSLTGWARRSPEDYEEEGKKFYKLAAEHAAACSFELSETLQLLHGNFHSAQKPLSFMAEHYLSYQRHTLFGLEAS